jgi:hypothetical protein
MIWQGNDISSVRPFTDALCALRTSDDAAEFWQVYIAYLNDQEKDLSGRSADTVARSNIGYVMGYRSAEERQRVYDLFTAFDVAHPVFGRNEPSPEAAFAAGEALVRRN